ncbi:MAG: DUF222 domain-containing protein, partial [Acidimicrobiales bacterium]|nr:DUF222 domain-containing protein [Acidimicrobiales bacterium]
MSAGMECRLQATVQRLSLIGDPSCRVGLLQKVVNLAQELLRREALRVKHDGGYRAEGFVSPGAWLACHTSLSGPAARAVVRQAVELQHMPASTAAAERGALSEQRVRLLTECRRSDPEQYDADTDAAFVALPVAELVLAARAWKAAAEDRRHDPNRPSGTPPEQASVHLSQLLDGRWRLDGVLNPHDGALLNQALDQSIARQLQAQRDGDPSVERLSVGAMRAQGLVDLAAQALRAMRPGRSHAAAATASTSSSTPTRTARRSSRTGRSYPKRGATAPGSASCSAPTASSSTSDAPPGNGPKGSGTPSSNAIAPAGSRTVTGPPTGAMSTTAPTG